MLGESLCKSGHSLCNCIVWAIKLEKGKNNAY